MTALKKLTCSIGIIVIAMTAVVSCLERYDPPITRENSNYLVVDAFLNTDGHVSVKLSRTLPLYSTDATPVESVAEIYLEAESGEKSLIDERYPGMYTDTAVIDISKKYRIRIRTSKDEEILSEYAEIKITPAIDSVYWKPASDGINIYLDTHDAENRTRYYKWDFSETFEYTSSFSSGLLFIDGEISLRPFNQYINKCWRTDLSSRIMVGSSVSRNLDEIRFRSITFIERASLKLTSKYSIQVEQRAITEECYNYWLQLEKTTESMGGLFDPMPTQVSGNFYNVGDPTEPVIGFFSAGSVRQKRTFITFNELPDHLKALPPTGCRIDSIPVDEIDKHGNSTLLIAAYGSPFIEGYTTSTNSCIDCRLQGGSTTRPDFWE